MCENLTICGWKVHNNIFDVTIYITEGEGGPVGLRNPGGKSKAVRTTLAHVLGGSRGASRTAGRRAGTHGWDDELVDKRAESLN